MGEKLSFIRLPVLLVFLFFIGRLALGAAGASYDAGNRVFSMVILQAHLALLWAAVGRRYRGYGIGQAIIAVVMIVFVSQLLIWVTTAVSYLAGINTYFNYPPAITGSSAPIPFGEAMLSRTITFIANCIMGAILGGIGWVLGGLIPENTESGRGLHG